jgi:hypothetical protein
MLCRRPSPDLAALLPSWELHLRAERKLPQTVKAYGDAVRAYRSPLRNRSAPRQTSKKGRCINVSGLIRPDKATHVGQEAGRVRRGRLLQGQLVALGKPVSEPVPLGSAAVHNLYFADDAAARELSAAQARTGTSRAAFIRAAIGRGKTISVL